MTFLPYKTADPAKSFHFALGESKETATGFVYYLSIPDVIQTMNWHFSSRRTTGQLM